MVATPRTLTWFFESVDVDVLLIALGLLDAEDVLKLAVASGTIHGRLACAGEAGGGCAAERLAAAKLGQGPAREAAAAALTSRSGGEATTSDEDGSLIRRYLPRSGDGPWAALRALASSAPVAKTLRHGIILMQSLHIGGIPARFSPETLNVVPAFLDALFKSDIQQQKRRRRGFAALAAANAALTALLVASDGGSSVMVAAAHVVRECERELDRLVEEGHAESFHVGYEAIARRRSAVEFLRSRVGFSNENICADEVANARSDLDFAIGELDETIRSYVREGYELACPKLASTITQCCAVPYAHWWIFTGKPYSHGWAVIR